MWIFLGKGGKTHQKAWQNLSIPGFILGKLEEIRDQERKEDTFTPMPSPYYMELTKLLLN